jgi:hypothetical protein
MCHTGCKYEYFDGECSLGKNQIPDDDAFCAVNDRCQAEAEERAEKAIILFNNRKRFFFNTKNYLLKRIELAGL